MNKTGIHLWLAIVASSLVACAKPSVSSLIANDFPNEQKQISKAVHDIFQAAKEKDIQRMAASHLYGPKFSKFDDWEPMTRQDALAVEKAEAEAFQSMDEFNFEINDLKVDVFGDFAIATFHIPYQLRVGKDEMATKARGTMVFLQTKDGWKIVHEHFSSFKPNP